jgi:hypothetical protein
MARQRHLDWFWPAAESADFGDVRPPAKTQVFGAAAGLHPQLSLIVDPMIVASDLCVIADCPRASGAPPLPDTQRLGETVGVAPDVVAALSIPRHERSSIVSSMRTVPAAVSGAPTSRAPSPRRPMVSASLLHQGSFTREDKDWVMGAPFSRLGWA